ncbi:MAG: alpha-hydroxy-acid oxidizing protein [Rhodospirillales bacterium]|nr:alpha-hydroxy-acid oxidizing protein [Rhodospirillales bacterium]
MRKFPSVADLEIGARRRLPRFAFDYLAGGAGDEDGIARNRAAYSDVQLVPNYLEERDLPDLSAGPFDRQYALPFGIAPVGLSGLIWPGAAEYLAAAARRADIPFCLSTMATSSIEAVGALSGDNGWFQLYPLKDHEIEKNIIDRARAAGFEVLVVTVDTPTTRRGLREIKNGLTVPPKLSPVNMARIAFNPAWALANLASGAPKFETLVPYYPKGVKFKSVAELATNLLARGIGWREIEALRKHWSGPMIVKGILSVSDARHCARLGVDGLLLSNHGGRQSESLVHPLQMIDEIRSAVGSGLKLLVDSGVRSGLDVARAYARGADFVFLGRAFMYAVAALGAPGADHGVDLLRTEVAQALAQIGCPDIASLPEFLRN